jgi:hypothetical protein
MSVAEVWLYGSSARGDRDAGSDVDVLIAGGDEGSLDDIELPSRERLSVSHYQWAEIEQMASYGSLFLHHLRLEGRPLVESPQRRLQALLDSLIPYRRAAGELASFRQVLDDVEDSLRGDFSASFELAVIATSARHAAILGCYVSGEPNFGRDSAIRQLLPRLGYRSEEIEEFVQLYRYRRAEDHGEPLGEEQGSDDVMSWVSRVRTLISEVEGLAGE